jgi:chromate transport protein ChrA
MRFVETLLLVFALIYVAQLIIAALILATLLLFLWCLWKRPREALVLGLAVLAVVVISKPIGLALVVVMAAGFGLWALGRLIRARRNRRAEPPIAFLPKF